MINIDFIFIYLCTCSERFVSTCLAFDTRFKPRGQSWICSQAMESMKINTGTVAPVGTRKSTPVTDDESHPLNAACYQLFSIRCLILDVHGSSDVVVDLHELYYLFQKNTKPFPFEMFLFLRNISSLWKFHLSVAALASSKGHSLVARFWGMKCWFREYL